MTRDEAIEKATAAHQFGNPVCSFIDMATAIGVLKLDEPKSLQRRINEAVWDHLWDKSRPETEIAPMDIVHALGRGGLKIVEK